MPDEAQICSCNNVSKGQICAAIREQNLESVGDVKQCTRAGTGCGGCLPLVTDLFHAELKKAGKVDLQSSVRALFALANGAVWHDQDQTTQNV